MLSPETGLSHFFKTLYLRTAVEAATTSSGYDKNVEEKVPGKTETLYHAGQLIKVDLKGSRDIRDTTTSTLYIILSINFLFINHSDIVHRCFWCCPIKLIYYYPYLFVLLHSDTFCQHCHFINLTRMKMNTTGHQSLPLPSVLLPTAAFAPQLPSSLFSSCTSLPIQRRSSLRREVPRRSRL